MVHTTTARSVNRAAISLHLEEISDTALSEIRPQRGRYVLIPDPLISAFAHDPLAVGVYVAVARLAMVTKAEVPLAARDLAIWMGSNCDADRIAIMRRIAKLEARGWLLITRTMAAKHRLLPTWGRDQAGAVRSWCFDTPDSGRPQHLRGRRVPIGLLDDYLGRLEPQHDSGRALISRYFTRPLLDLTDIGVYTIGLRAEIPPTPHLRHLELCSEAGMLPLPDTQSLLAQAAAGAITTYVDDTTIMARLSVHGYARLGLCSPMIEQSTYATTKRPDGSPHGSGDGSHDAAGKPFDNGCQEGANRVEGISTALIAWDVGMIHESTNHESTADPMCSGGGRLHGHGNHRVATHALRKPDVAVPANHPIEAVIPNALDGKVVTGHHLLNPERMLCTGEWLELLALQTAHGVEQILIWQARAGRATMERPFGVSPAYYHACAARSIRAASRSATTIRRNLPAREQVTTPVLDLACESLLQAMGVRERRQLSAVPHTLIAAWAEVITHPGLVARFNSPVGFAVRQMRKGQVPPAGEELDRWAERARQINDRYEAWRYIEHPTAAVEQAADEQRLEARVRAIAPPEADLAELCELARALEAGATDTEALAQFTANRVAGAK